MRLETEKQAAHLSIFNGILRKNPFIGKRRRNISNVIPTNPESTKKQFSAPTYCKSI